MCGVSQAAMGGKSSPGRGESMREGPNEQRTRDDWDNENYIMSSA